MKLPTLSPLKLFAPAPARPAMAGSAMGGSIMLASGSGSGSGGGDEDDFGFADDFEAQDSAPERRPSTPRSGRGNGGGDTNGRRRTVQFEPEERYWTDYLRIALPVIGLLLMIGLLWFWAQQIISDDPETTQPNATEDVGLVTTITPSPTEEAAISTPPADTTQGNQQTTTEQQGQQAQPTAQTNPPTDTQQTTGGDNQAANPPADTPPPADEPTAGGAIAIDAQVSVTEVLNMRAEPNTAGGLVRELPAGETLTVIGGPQEGEDFVWWEVVDAEGNAGWVVENYIQVAQ